MNCPNCDSHNVFHLEYDEDLDTDVYECSDCGEVFKDGFGE